METLKAVVAGVLGASLVMFTWNLASPEPAKFEQLERSVVKVQYNEGYGSGVLVSRNKVITAKHVVDASKDSLPAIAFADGHVAKVYRIDRHPTLDVAVITLADVEPSARVAEWTCQRPELNTDLLAIGNPLAIAFGAFHFVVAGETMDTPSLPKGSMVIQGPSNPGLSGGPAFNPQGQVVGLVTHHVRSSEVPSTGLGLMLPLSAFCEGGHPWFGSAS